MHRLTMLAAGLVLAIGTPAPAYDSVIKTDTDTPYTPLRTLRLQEGYAYSMLVKVYEQNVLDTGVAASDTCTIRIGTTANAASFITATSTVTTAASAQFTVPLTAAHTATNGTFWYGVFFYASGTGTPYDGGTGTCIIAESSAAGAVATQSLSIALNLSAYTITGTLPAANIPTNLASYATAAEGDAGTNAQARVAVLETNTATAAQGTLATAAMPRTGGTFSGDVTMGAGTLQSKVLYFTDGTYTSGLHHSAFAVSPFTGGEFYLANDLHIIGGIILTNVFVIQGVPTSTNALVAGQVWSSNGVMRIY